MSRASCKLDHRCDDGVRNRLVGIREFIHTKRTRSGHLALKTLRSAGDGRTDQERISDGLRQRIIALGVAFSIMPAAVVPDPSAAEDRPLGHRVTAATI